MLVFLAILLSFSTYLVVATAQECYDGNIRMINETVVAKVRETYNMAGGLQICVNRQWATVCQNGLEDGKMGSEPSASYNTTDKDNSIPTTAAAMCLRNVCQACGRQFNESTAAATDEPFDVGETENSPTTKSSCSNDTGTVALSVIAALEGVVLIGVVISLIITCFKLHKHSSSALILKTNRSMDNRTYDMTDFPTSQPPQVASADTLPNQMNLPAASLAGAAEGLYDTVASEDSAAGEAVNSMLVDSGTAGIASQNDKQNENAGNEESPAPMSEAHLDSDPVYQILKCDNYQM